MTHFLSVRQTRTTTTTRFIIDRLKWSIVFLSPLLLLLLRLSLVLSLACSPCHHLTNSKENASRERKRNESSMMRIVAAIRMKQLIGLLTFLSFARAHTLKLPLCRIYH